MYLVKLAKMVATELFDPYWQNNACNMVNGLLDLTLAEVLENCPENATYKCLATGSDGVNNKNVERHSATKLVTMDKSNRAIQLSYVDAYIPRVKRLLLETAELIGAKKVGRTNANAYFSASGAGFPWHYDVDYAISFQIAGEKVWRYRQNEARINDSLPYMVGDEGHGVGYAEKFENYEEVILQPGGVIFIPKHCWHMTKSMTESFSLSLIYTELKK